jgi:hypothetical protein
LKALRLCFLISVILVFAAGGAVDAQEADTDLKISAELDKKEADIAEEIRYSISVVTDRDTEISFPDADEFLSDFSLKDSKLTQRVFFNRKTVSKQYIFQGYIPAKYTIPKTVIKYRKKTEDQWQQAQIPQQTIEIRSALAQAGYPEKLCDIKGPLGPARSWAVLLIAAVAALLIITALILMYLSRKKKMPQPVPKRPAHEVAYEQLEEQKRKDLIAKGKIKQYYSEVSDIIRHYLEGRFSLNAPEMTTEEFLFYVRDYAQLLAEHKGLLREFLLACDLVKFARYTPSPEEIDSVFASAKKFVDQTKQESLADNRRG